MRKLCLVTLVAVALALVVGACGGGTEPGQAPTTPQGAADTVASGNAAGDELFDVGGGVNLYLNCEGTSSPTIVYLHGAIDNPGFSGASSASGLQQQLSSDYRFCRYDRRNVGNSDSVDGYFTGVTAVADLHSLLGAADIKPPYVLLGASFGGLLAHMFASTYPDEVVGMVSLDGVFPQEVTLDPLLPEEMRYSPDEDRDSVERLSHLAALNEALLLAPPDIPFHYLLATPSEWPTLGVPAYDDVILDLLAEYVASYPQGSLTEVESPHYMEPEVPDIIIEHLRQVIQEAGY